MMNEVIPGLWIGDLPSAMDVEKLKSNQIFSILSAMRGRITVNETFIRHQILIDDTEDADILVHLLPSIHFIQAELDKGRGVLVHCQAGVSRSATIVAAYLMYRDDLDPEGALEVIRKARPYIDPNPNFLQQLELFHKTHYRISKKEKDIRRYYLERTVEEVMSGDGTITTMNMLASYPRTPNSDSVPSTPVPVPRRRIRCKMCRQELATREHMLDHGQLGPETPASMTPAASRRPSEVQQKPLPVSVQMQPGAGQRRPSRSRLSFGSSVLGDSFTMSPIDSGGSKGSGSEESPTTAVPLVRNNSGAERLKTFRSVSRGLMEASLTMTSSAVDDDDDGEGDDEPGGGSGGEGEGLPDHINVQAAKLLGRRLSDAVMASAAEPNSNKGGHEVKEMDVEPMKTHLISPANLAAQLYANPKLAALRAPSFSSGTGTNSASRTPIVTSAPIIVNPKCSGYFVEPMTWMEPFLQEGHLSGKIICPNEKCGAKLGNYDWAGVCCGCKSWVVPGFCITRSKVDEVTV